MTVIRPNSISGITSLTAHRGSIDFYAHDGSAATFTNINSNVTSGVSTFASLNITGDLDVGGALTYEDVTNVDSIGVVTARNGIDVTGGTVTITSGTNSASPAASGDNLVIKDNDGCGLSILSGNGNSQNIYLGSVSDNDAVRLEGYYNSGSPYFNIYTAGSERLRITSNGNIGVGGATGTDYSLLDGIVTNTANGSAGLLINSSSSSHNAYMSFGYGSGSGTSHADQFSAYIGRVGDNTLILGTNNNIRLRIGSDGHLSYKNSSPPAWSSDSGYANATLGSSAYFRTDTDVNSNFFSIGSNAYRSSSNWQHVNSGWATQLQQSANDGDLTYRTSSTNGSAGGTISWVEHVRIKSNGDMGVGTVSPTARLDVRRDDADGKIAEFHQSTGYGIQIRSSESVATIRAEYNQALVFETGTTATERFRITSDGKIGIGHHTPTQISTGGSELTIRPANDGGILIGRPGDTVAPINKALTITTTTTGSEAYHTKYHTYNCNSIFATYDAGGTGGNIIFKTGVGSGQEVERLRITSGGDLVIGTTAAARGPLHIHKNSADCYLHVTNSTTGTGSGDGFTIHQSGVETLLNNRESGNMRLYTNGGEKVRITSSGRVLVGKSISQATSTIENCDVDFHCTGPLSVGSNSNANQAQMQRVGRRVINLYNTTYSSSGGPYLHLETSLWGGGSPYGNSEFIMGGFHIHGYRYSSSGICEEIIYFHQWNGSLANYSRHQYGNWNAGSSCYVGSNGNVYIKLPNTAYYGFAIDFIQHPWYDARDCTILNATFNNGTNL